MGVKESSKKQEKLNGVIPEEQICFSFKYFQTNSVRVRKFNNFYLNQISSINAVNDFFETVKQMGRLPKNKLFSPEYKEQFHLNQIDEDEVINLIEYVLREGYGFSQKNIDNFERTYMEFSTTNGKRVICALLYGTLFECLFLDPNHLICRDSSRNVKVKEGYQVKSAFEKWDEDMLGLSTPMLNDYIEMLIDDYRQGLIEEKIDFIEQYDEIKRENI